MSASALIRCYCVLQYPVSIQLRLTIILFRFFPVLLLFLLLSTPRLSHTFNTNSFTLFLDLGFFCVLLRITLKLIYCQMYPIMAFAPTFVIIAHAVIASVTVLISFYVLPPAVLRNAHSHSLAHYRCRSCPPRLPIYTLI